MKKLTFLLILIVALAASLNGQRQKSKLPPTPLNPLKGFANITEVTAGPGLAATNEPYSKLIVGLTTVNGYQINKYFIAGAGTGFFVFNEGFLVPLYLSGRYTYPIDKSNISPYINADLGALFNFGNSGGGTRIFVNPVLGARYTLSSTTALDFGVGLYTMKLPEGNRDSYINFKVGFLFLPRR
jgi:hypothetical protein